MKTKIGSLSPAQLASVTGGTVLLPAAPKPLPPEQRCDPWSCEDMRRIQEMLNQQPTAQRRPNRLPHGTTPGVPGQRRPNYR
jgi:hypothetical protein